MNALSNFSESVFKAASIIKKGGVVVFPTTTLYGLGADALNPNAVDRVFTIKGRPENKPILVLIDDKIKLKKLVRHVPPSTRCLMSFFWPGQITLIFEAQNHLPQNLTAKTGKIGVRVCAHPIARALIKAIDRPMTGTSANLSSEPGCSKISDISPALFQSSDMVLDAGTLKGGKGSTIIDVTEIPPRILREGTVSAENIQTALKKMRNSC